MGDSMRGVMVGAMVFIGAAFNGYLIYKEELCPSEAKATHIMSNEDPLLSVVYSKGTREANFKAFGMDEAMVKAAMDRMRDLDDRHAEKMKLLLENCEEPTELADAICGQTNQVRPRYGALRFLVVEQQGERRPIQIARVTGLERQDWALVSPISSVYNEVELADDRQPDATIMGIAAILTAQEEAVQNSYAPWGRGLAATWSWRKVKKDFPGTEDRVVEYLTLMHLAVEFAQQEDGICGQ